MNNDSNASTLVGQTTKPSITIEMFEKLNNYEDYGTLWDLACSFFTPIEILRKLSKNKDAAIRRNVDSNFNTPSDVLEELSKEPNKFVRLAVSYNTNTPNEVLKHLLNDDFCKNAAMKTLIENKNLKLFT